MKTDMLSLTGRDIPVGVLDRTIRLSAGEPPAGAAARIELAVELEIYRVNQ